MALTTRDVYQASLTGSAIAADTGFLLIDRSAIATSSPGPFGHLTDTVLRLHQLQVAAQLTTTLAATWNIRVGVVGDVTATSGVILWLAQYDLSNVSPTFSGLHEFDPPLNLTLRYVAFQASDLAEAGTSATATVATNGFTNVVVGQFIRYTTGAASGLRRRITTVTDPTNIVQDTFGATAPADGDAFVVEDVTGTAFVSGNRSLNSTLYQTDVTLACANGILTAPATGDLVVLFNETSGTETLTATIMARYSVE